MRWIPYHLRGDGNLFNKDCRGLPGPSACMWFKLLNPGRCFMRYIFASVISISEFFILCLICGETLLISTSGVLIIIAFLFSFILLSRRVYYYKSNKKMLIGMHDQVMSIFYLLEDIVRFWFSLCIRSLLDVNRQLRSLSPLLIDVNRHLMSLWCMLLNVTALFVKSF